MEDTQLLVNWSERHSLFEPWLFWRLKNLVPKKKKKKNLVPYGWPPKNKLKPSTYVTTETNCEVCCQINKMYCFLGKNVLFWEKDPNRHFSKEDMWPTGTRKMLNIAKQQDKCNFIPYSLGWLVSKNYKITRVGKDAENLLIGMWNGVVAVDNKVVSQKIKNRTIKWSSKSYTWVDNKKPESSVSGMISF